MTEITKTGPSDPELLIDGDIFLYRCGFAVERTKYLVQHPGDLFTEVSSAKEAKVLHYEGTTDFNVVWSRKEYEPVENALQATKNSLKEVWDKFWPDKGTWRGSIYLTGKGNFRDSIECRTGYKDNRDPAHRPKHYRAIKDFLVKKYGALIVNGMEADDAIGIRAYQLPVDKYIVVSNDKDLDQISGFHYNWITKELYYVNEEDAAKYFYIQLLGGDSTDNIPGIVSPDKAKKIIEGCKSPQDCAKTSLQLYETEHGELASEIMSNIAKLVWIKRTEDGKPPVWEHLHGET